MAFLFFEPGKIYAVRPTITPAETPTASPSAEPTAEVQAIPTPRPDITQKTQETTGPLEQLLKDQKLGSVWPTNPIKYAIRGAVDAGVPANTIVLLLLLPGIAAFIAAARHLVGLRGFGIYLPAALSVAFVAIGPVIGIGLFLVIVLISTGTRITLRHFKIKLQYLPRMALLLYFVVLGVLMVLFAAPLVRQPDFANVSIFPVLFLALLAEDFSRVQLGKSAKIAINLTTETLILALLSYIFLVLKPVQKFVLLYPEGYILLVAAFDILMGRYVGLRFMEYWRFRKLLNS